MNLAVVPNSSREKHLQLREKLLAKMAIRPNMVDFYKFHIWREQPQGFDNSLVELLQYTARSRADLASFVQEKLLGADPEFTRKLWDTFTCRACMAVDRQFGPELQFALMN